MKAITNISLVYECDRSTLERATALANQHGARLTIHRFGKPCTDESDDSRTWSCHSRSVSARSSMRACALSKADGE